MYFTLLNCEVYCSLCHPYIHNHFVLPAEHQKNGSPPARVARFLLKQTCQSWKNIPQTLPNCHKIYKNGTKIYSIWSQIRPTFSILRPTKIYPNRDFWYENKESGNPTVLPAATTMTTFFSSGRFSFFSRFRSFFFSFVF
jgi:hypothetical protein